MARSDSFFLRATVPTDTTAFNQVQIDLGSVVNVLAKDILRIHNIQVEYGAPAENIQNLAGDQQTELSFQLTTQSQGDLVPLSNRSVVSSGQLKVSTGTVADVPIVYSDTMNASIQEWTNGYLIAVESLYLGCQQGADILSQVSIILECTSETMSQAAAMALSLSQQ
jgi:hypothetical protein|tara:strand:+ start:1286 stop:1786 length:501 start_codon:yes stop_codon:yes gene_type:complete